MLVKKDGRAKKSVKETFEIIEQYGLATSENVTRRLIREGKIKATPLGKTENDKRSGYVIYERDIYKFITDSIPVMKDIFAKLERLESIEVKNKKQKVAE